MKALGTRIKTGFGYSTQEWELVNHNDILWPYFSKVVRGVVQKKQFTVHGYDIDWMTS